MRFADGGDFDGYDGWKIRWGADWKFAFEYLGASFYPDPIKLDLLRFMDQYEDLEDLLEFVLRCP